MKVFCCGDSVEEQLTGIYDAWCAALDEGHENVRLVKGPVCQQSFLEEYIFVEPDQEKVKKVIRSIQNKISGQAYMGVFYACLSKEEDALQACYDFLRLGFQMGGQVIYMQTDARVIRMMELQRTIQNEYHSFREFARFSSLDGKIYVSHIEPKNNIAILVANHFMDRMPSEHWMIIDDKRRIAVVHPKDEEMYVRNLTEEEFLALQSTKDVEDLYTDLWKTFFYSISIKERENRRCQRNMFPIWKRKNAVEFDS